jgi:hypothetical protein
MASVIVLLTRSKPRTAIREIGRAFNVGAWAVRRRYRIVLELKGEQNEERSVLSEAKDGARKQGQGNQACRDREGPLYQRAGPAKYATEDQHADFPPVLLV